ncbi:MAG: hypothetical protein Kow006_01640 [Gammaproteobacteria bacterium]
MQLLLLLGILVAAVLLVQVGLLAIALDKLGISAQGAFLLLMSSLAGSLINLPLGYVRSDPPPPGLLDLYRRRSLWFPPRYRPGRTLIMVNVGGCLIPLAFCLYLLVKTPITLGDVLVGAGIVTLVCRFVSRPVPGMGIVLPLFVAPLFAALTAVLVAPDNSAPVAYVSGTLGVLIGADLLRLGDVRHMGAPMASIGGAGTYDGIFVTGIVAALLA